jgi:RimJ/RimL family protein N-acetyltransferase
MAAPMIVLRPVCISDAEVLFAWRNDPDTYTNSSTNRPVAWDEHVDWLTESLLHGRRELLIGVHDETPVGVIHADHKPGWIKMGWSIAPRSRRKGYGKEMVKLAAEHFPGLLIAFIKPLNVASQKIADAAGFKLAGNEGKNANFCFTYERK